MGQNMLLYYRDYMPSQETVLKSRLSLLLVSLLLLSNCTSVDTSQNVNSALAKIIQLANNGDADSQFRLGIRYTNGSGVRQDYASAAHWFELASAKGHHNSEYMLAIAHSTGRGTNIDQQRALELFTRAAEAGHVRSQYQLGEAYANGRGAAKDLIWASRWYEKAALQKHPEALFSLGIFRAKGLDGKADQRQAWLWLNLAAGLEHSGAAQIRDRIASTMTPSSLSQVRKKADDWIWPNENKFADAPTVRYLQRALNILGYTAGPEVGLAGPTTKSAIFNFTKVRKASINAELISRLRTALLTN